MNSSRMSKGVNQHISSDYKTWDGKVAHKLEYLEINHHYTIRKNDPIYNVRFSIDGVHIDKDKYRLTTSFSDVT